MTTYRIRTPWRAGEPRVAKHLSDTGQLARGTGPSGIWDARVRLSLLGPVSMTHEQHMEALRASYSLRREP